MENRSPLPIPRLLQKSLNLSAVVILTRTMVTRRIRLRAASSAVFPSQGQISPLFSRRRGRPSPTQAAHVREDLEGKIDMIIDGGSVGIGLESTIVDFTEEEPVILRPGYINQEMMEAVIGQVKMDKGLLITDEKVRPKAPGMKYRGNFFWTADLCFVYRFFAFLFWSGKPSNAFWSRGNPEDPLW